MGAVHVHEFMSLDGVFEDPSWTFEFGFHDKLGEHLAELTGKCKAILLGRTTFEMFAPAWSTRTIEDDPGAPFFNDTTKYVVSSTLGDAESIWRNSETLGAYDADAIGKLKQSVDGDIYVSGSGQLVRAMLQDGLVDELHVVMYPVTLGKGARLFSESAGQVKMSLALCDAFDNGVVYLNYKPQS